MTDGVHHGIVEGIPAGSRYGFRATPDHEALPLSMPATDFDARGEQPLLLDPYGRAVDEREDFITSVRMDSDFDWGNDRGPRTPWRNTIIYEAHVRGQTKLHPDVPEDLQGTYAGLAHPAMIEHLIAPGDHRRPAPAGALPRGRTAPAEPRHDELLGLQHGRVLRPAPRLRHPGRAGRGRRRPSRTSSRAWSSCCTPPGWRSSSTSSTTTRPRAAGTAGPSASAAWAR